MTTPKEFDCVEMKREIQRRLREAHGGKSRRDRNQEVRESIRGDRHLARLLELTPTMDAQLPEPGKA